MCTSLNALSLSLSERLKEIPLSLPERGFEKCSHLKALKEYSAKRLSLWSLREED